MKKTYKNIFITGASRGIGRALAYEYAGLGCSVTICARTTDELKAVCDDINSGKGKCYYLTSDVTNFNDVSSAVNYAKDMMGSVDVAILNAGTGGPVWMNDFKSEEYIYTMGVNSFGIAHALEVLIPIMKKQGYGTIAGVSTLADIRGYTGSSSYNASKAAASILLESARVELKKYNINVITVRPGFVKTAMTDKNEFYMPMIMQPEKAAVKIRKGIEKGKSIVQFPWPLALATRMIKFIPNWLFDSVSRLARPVYKNSKNN